jgi:hypothetical protein
MPDMLALIERVGLTSRGQLPAYTTYGGYPLVYLTSECETLCADCATADYFGWLYALGTCDGWQYDPPVMVDVYYEGPDETCANCNSAIPSAYGDPR